MSSTEKKELFTTLNRDFIAHVADLISNGPKQNHTASLTEAILNYDEHARAIKTGGTAAVGAVRGVACVTPPPAVGRGAGEKEKAAAGGLQTPPDAAPPSQQMPPLLPLLSPVFSSTPPAAEQGTAKQQAFSPKDEEKKRGVLLAEEENYFGTLVASLIS